MTTVINKKITGQKIVKDTPVNVDESLPTEPAVSLPDILHENMSRPEVLFGSTYKIKTPQSEHAMYVTINDIILNPDTVHEVRLPYEIFINSKNMEHFQWVLALTRVMSAAFRKGGDVCFLVDELKAVFDPKGGYFKKGGVYMPSLVAEIGYAIESHLKQIGLIQVPGLTPEQQVFVDKKREEFVALQDFGTPDAGTGFPAKATVCVKCSTKAVVLMDGCMTCLNCGESKCG